MNNINPPPQDQLIGTVATAQPPSSLAHVANANANNFVPNHTASSTAANNIVPTGNSITASPIGIGGTPSPTTRTQINGMNAIQGHNPQMNANAAAALKMMTQNGVFTPDQLITLRNQIMAFKRIAKNLPLPPNIQSALFNNTKQSPQMSPSVLQQPSMQTQTGMPGLPAQAQQANAVEPNSKITNPQQVVAAPVNTQTQKIFQTKQSEAPKEEPKSHPAHMNDPFKLLVEKLRPGEHMQRDKRPLIPAIFPEGVNVIDYKMAKENALRTRIKLRIQELEQLPSNIQSANKDAPEKVKMRALIELKSLKLMDKQRELRRKMFKSYVDLNTINIDMDRAQYRRVKKQSLREVKMTENLERQQRLDRERRQRKAQEDYVQSIFAHGRDISAASRAKAAKQQKIGKAVLMYHNYVEKEEQRRIERTAKQRLQALRADDEDAYMKLIDQAKDTRITHLLHQTDAYLDSLAQSVQSQQQEASAYDTVDDSVMVDGDILDENGQARTDYYGVAHRIQETITEQPSILVGGALKDYQIKGLQWMVSLYNNKLNGILADEMGLGKTIQTISLITFLIEKKKQHGPFLVIVPLSTLTNWTLEFEKWAPSVSKLVYKGPPQVRKMLAHQVRAGTFQVLLTTYEFIINDRPILSKPRWIYMVIDEGHRMKNTQSKLSSTLAQYYHARHRLILTGTPLQNNLPELWALLNFALPKIFSSVKSFDEWFNAPFANTGGGDRMELTEEEGLLVIRRLHKVLRPFLLRRLKKDVESELPDKVERVIKCKLSGIQSRLYQQMSQKGSFSIARDDKGKPGIILLFLRKWSAKSILARCTPRMIVSGVFPANLNFLIEYCQNTWLQAIVFSCFSR